MKKLKKLKRVCFILSLIFINSSLIVWIIGLKFNVASSGLFGTCYLMCFAIMYFGDKAAIICTFLVILSVLALLNFLVIFSYKKNRFLNIIPIALCIWDCVYGFILNNYSVAILDLVLSVLLLIMMIKTKEVSKRDDAMNAGNDYMYSK